MPNTIADRFIESLNTLEADRNAQPIAELFTAEAEVGNVIAPEKFHGVEGARDFWTKYRDTFETMKSTFRNKITGDGQVALEWNTEGTSARGHKFQYSGVSILEVEGEKIKRFRAYFDAAALGRQIEDGKS